MRLPRGLPLNLTIIATISLIILTYQIFHTATPTRNHAHHPIPSPTTPNGPIENIPAYYLNTTKRPLPINTTCAKHPDLWDIHFENDHWQIQKTANGTLHLLNAYIDRRIQPETRIIAMYDVINPNHTFWCQYWQPGAKPTIVETTDIKRIWVRGWGGNKGNNPYLITCPLPLTRPAQSVSLVGTPCTNATNNLALKESTMATPPKNFVVCVKGLNFPFEDKSTRLIEWIELLRLLGVDKINFYKFHVHPAISRILEYYVQMGVVEATPLSLVGHYSNSPYLQNLFLHKKLQERRLQEVIPYNDCLYKHLNEFRFVVLLDTDEVIVPVRGTWVELLEAAQRRNNNRTSYVARNVYFLDSHLHGHEWFGGVPRYMHMLQHVERARNYTKPGFFVKGFHRTQHVMTLHNHFPLHCVGGKGCVSKELDLGLAHLQHYRSDCVKGVGNCDEMKRDSVTDLRVWNFKEDLVRRVKEVMGDLGVVGEEEG